MSGASGEAENIPAIKITPAMIEAGLDVLWEHRALINLESLGPDFQETLVRELLSRALAVAPLAPSAAPK